MNIIEAKDSGKPFRRKAWKTRYWYQEFATCEGALALARDMAGNPGFWKLCPEDIAADDYETMPEPREWWVVLDKDDSQLAFSSEAEAARHNARYGKDGVIRVREVMPE